MAIDGTISFPGLQGIQYVQVAVRTNGLRPNRAIVVSEPSVQTSPPSLVGSFVFGFNGTNVTWQNALCDSALMRVSPDGHQCFWVIQDGRWRWWKNFVTSAFNVRLPDGTIDSDTTKTLAEIVTFLFNGMGVSADVSAITSSEKPECIFDHDRVVPELEELLEPRGYVCSYQLDGSAKIFRVGQGATMPNDEDVVSFSNSMNPPELPETLRARGARTFVQSKLKCVAVGEDTDGKVKEIKDLAYNPGGVGNETGWDSMDLTSFTYITDPVAQALAKKSVGKWYQAKFQADGTFNLSAGGVDYCPGEITVTSALQYLPLSDKMVSAAVDIHGKKRLDDAYVEGTFWIEQNAIGEGNPAKARNSEDFSRFEHRKWTLDKELGIVMFSEVLRKKGSGGAFTFADVYFVCSYSIHPNTNHIKDRFIRDRSLGGTGGDQVNSEELERTLKCEYGTDNITISTIVDNETTVQADADLLLDNVVASYSTGMGNTILYRGTRAYSTDGINLQVVWRCAVPGSKTPFSTFVSQNLEAHPLAPRSRDRRQARQNERTNLWNTSRGRRYRNAKKGGKY